MKTIKTLEKENKLLREQLRLKEKLETPLPFHIEPKLEVGKWYRNSNLKTLICYTGNEEGYGFTASETWYKNQKWCSFEKWRITNTTPATDKEVEEALISEAKKRFGNAPIKDGTEFKDRGNISNINARGWETCKWDGVVLHYARYTLFKDGKWAEIIEEKAPTIAGYEMEVGDGKITFGCKSFTTTRVLALYKNMKVLGMSGVCYDDSEITIDQLKEIVKYLDK